MKAVICPVCEGSGKYKDKKCHGCDGKGWVSVMVDYPPCYPSIDREPYDPNKWFVTASETNSEGYLNV